MAAIHPLFPFTPQQQLKRLPGNFQENLSHLRRQKFSLLYNHKVFLQQVLLKTGSWKMQLSNNEECPLSAVSSGLDEPQCITSLNPASFYSFITSYTGSKSMALRCISNPCKVNIHTESLPKNLHLSHRFQTEKPLRKFPRQCSQN